MNIQKQKNNESRAEVSAAAATHQHKVHQLLQEAVDGGFLTEVERARCVENADGSRWGDNDHSRRTDGQSCRSPTGSRLIAMSQGPQLSRSIL